MTPREEAIADCKYGYELGKHDGKFTALHFHIGLWYGHRPQDDADDREYRATINEIKQKLFTDECLLK